MNFADIRDMEKRQGVFWAIALPVTAGIIVIAIFLANHGDKALGLILQFLHQPQGIEQDSQVITAFGGTNGVWNSSSTILPQTQITKRRKRFSLQR